MKGANALYSPKQVANALAVSESSIKRWCDDGKLRFSRTAGGHRRIRRQDVVDFVRHDRHRLVDPEMIGLEPEIRDSLSQTHVIATSVTDALLSGDEQSFRALLFQMYFSKLPISTICDRVVAPAFHEIGMRWECNEAEVFQERRSCEICIRSFAELRNLQPIPSNDVIAIGGTLEGDIYSLPTMMVELVLRDCGVAATSLGSGIPFTSYQNAIDDLKPSLVWLSVSHVVDEVEFIRQFEAFSRYCLNRQVALIVGGRSLTEPLRKKVSYSAFCDTLLHLETFVHTQFKLQKNR